MQITNQSTPSFKYYGLNCVYYFMCSEMFVRIYLIFFLYGDHFAFHCHILHEHTFFAQFNYFFVNFFTVKILVNLFIEKFFMAVDIEKNYLSIIFWFSNFFWDKNWCYKLKGFFTSFDVVLNIFQLIPKLIVKRFCSIMK